MTIATQLAKHLRDVHFGGNWTTTNLRQVLEDVTWEQAIRQHGDVNTIVTLTYHITYYVGVLRKVLEGGPLDAKDEYSFQHPAIRSQEDWLALQQRAWADAEATARLLEQLPDEHLDEFFTAEKYGTWFRNVAGIIEHLHYHLGQIVLLKKLVQS